MMESQRETLGFGKITVSSDYLEIKNDEGNNSGKKCLRAKCSYPNLNKKYTSYLILFIIEVIVYILTFCIQKGLFDTIEYSAEDKIFIIRTYGDINTIVRVNATQEELDKRGISVSLSSFVNGIINKPIAIPDTYKKIESENFNFFQIFNLLSFPIKGLIDSADICFYLLITGGTINILVDMNIISSGIKALGEKLAKHKLILLYIISSLFGIGGTTFGFLEEILSFFKILMPIFLNSDKFDGFDGLLPMAGLYMGTICGNMFSITNGTSVVIASIIAGIDFMDGILLRTFGFVVSILLTFLYLGFYYNKIKKDESKSLVNDIHSEILKKYGKGNNKHQDEPDDQSSLDNSNSIEQKDEEDNNIKNDDNIEVKTEVIDKDEKENNENIKDKNENNNENINEKANFSCRELVALILFAISIIVLVSGVIILKWSIVEMATIFFIYAIILIAIYYNKEKVGDTIIESFIKGAGDYCGVVIIIGIARGIHLILQNGKISDTILNSMSNWAVDIPKYLFGFILFIFNIIFGLFIQSSSALAVLTMPPLAPLADKVHVSRSVVVNAYMFGQTLIGLIAPTGMIVLILEDVNPINYSHLLKFIWPYMIILFLLSFLLLLLNTYYIN